jgi:secondary thiamine-phosphate synthase enzyme
LINFSTGAECELVNITEQVQSEAAKAKIKNGIALVFAPHATGSIIICEDEPGLKKDVIDTVKKLFPKNAGYEHDRIDDNAHAHLISSFLGCSKAILIENGKLILGTWQSIFFLETDGPRARRVVIACFGR